MAEKQHLLDRFTRQDELLAQMIPILEDIRDQSSGDAQDVFVLSYPYDATHLTIAAGTTVYDFEHGTVVAPGVAVVQMSNSLRQDDKTFMRSLVIDSNKDTVLQLDGQDKMIVHAGRWLFPYKQFRKVLITATESTEVFVVASTNPSTVDVAGEFVIRGDDSGTLRTVAVDDNGNMVTLMKGDDGANLQTIKVDAAGQMYVAMTGQSLGVNNHPSDYFKADESAVVKGDDGGTKRLVAVDSSGIMLSRMKGAYGAVLKDILLDDTGIMLSRMKGSYGGTLKDIEVDTDGNMISVMKGNYGGVLKTWKVDTDGRGEMFISDPSDVWGNVNSMGLGEHAVRTHAPPITFDRRGSAIRWVDFEHAVDTVDDWNSASLISRARSTDCSGTGDFAYKIVVGNGGYFGGVNRVNDYHVGRIGNSVLVASTHSSVRVGSLVVYYDGTNRWLSLLHVDLTNGYVYVGTGTGNHVGTITYYPSIRNFSTVKSVVNLSTHEYVRGIVFGTEIDLSAYSMASSSDARDGHLCYGVWYESLSGERTLYIDNIVFTENEPEN